MRELLKEFIRDVGGPSNAASTLCVSGAIIHRWKQTEPNRQAAEQIEIWFRFPDEHARFILRNVWAKGTTWNPRKADYTSWLERETTFLWHHSGQAPWVRDLWEVLASAN